MKYSIVLLLALLCGCATQPAPKPAPAQQFSSAPSLPAPSAPVVKGSPVRRTLSTTSTNSSGTVTVQVSRSVAPPPSVTLAWDASVDPTVTGYNLYYGGASRVYTNVINVGTNISQSVSNLAFGATYYFAATDYTAAGLESDYSAEAFWTSPSLVMPPGNFRIKASFASSLPGPWQQDTNWPAITVSNALGNIFWRLDAERNQ